MPASGQEIPLDAIDVPPGHREPGASKDQPSATARARAKRFDQHAAGITGLSPRAIRNAVQRGEAFDDEDRAILKAKGVDPWPSMPIARIKDPAVRKQALRILRAQDKPDVAEAVRLAVGGKAKATGPLLTVPGDPEKAARRLAAFFTAEALDDLVLDLQGIIERRDELE